jgi:hypothetical protein
MKTRDAEKAQTFVDQASGSSAVPILAAPTGWKMVVPISPARGDVAAALQLTFHVWLLVSDYIVDW